MVMQETSIWLDQRFANLDPGCLSSRVKDTELSFIFPSGLDQASRQRQHVSSKLMVPT